MLRVGEVGKIGRIWCVIVKSNEGLCSDIETDIDCVYFGCSDACPLDEWDCHDEESFAIKIEQPSESTRAPGQVFELDVVVPSLADVEAVAKFYQVSVNSKQGMCRIPAGAIDGLVDEVVVRCNRK